MSDEKQSVNPADRRTSSRYDVRLSAEVSCDSRRFTTRTRNVSVGGVCLETATSLPHGAPVELALFLVVDEIEDPALPQLVLRGSIAWSKAADATNPPQVGVKFDRISPQQVAGLTRFLKVINR